MTSTSELVKPLQIMHSYDNRLSELIDICMNPIFLVVCTYYYIYIFLQVYLSYIIDKLYASVKLFKYKKWKTYHWNGQKMNNNMLCRIWNILYYNNDEED